MTIVSNRWIYDAKSSLIAVRFFSLRTRPNTELFVKEDEKNFAWHKTKLWFENGHGKTIVLSISLLFENTTSIKVLEKPWLWVDSQTELSKLYEFIKDKRWLRQLVYKSPIMEILLVGLNFLSINFKWEWWLDRYSKWGLLLITGLETLGFKIIINIIKNNLVTFLYKNQEPTTTINSITSNHIIIQVVKRSIRYFIAHFWLLKDNHI